MKAKNNYHHCGDFKSKRWCR